MLAYEAVARNYMDHYDIKYNDKSAFFINSQGNPLLNGGTRSKFDWSHVAIVLGIPEFHSHMARKMFSQLVANQNTILAREVINMFSLVNNTCFVTYRHMSNT